MRIELYENEYAYIFQCFSDLLPSYIEQINKTLFIDYTIATINHFAKPIYSFELDVNPKDVDNIKQMAKKLQKHRTLEQYELYDKYADFFYFIIDHYKKDGWYSYSHTVNLFTDRFGGLFLYQSSYIWGKRHPRRDVIGILDNSGNTVVKYTYDAYGNCTRGYTTNTDLADSNPIRYRSYYYDKDTGLYYLNARYYNPQWRRFISPDNTAYLDVENANGLNLYAYCNNDPINYKDPSGHFGIFATILISTIIGAAIGAGVNLGKQLIQNDFNLSEVNLWEVGASALTVAVTGLAWGLGGVAGGIVKGSFHALTIAGKALSASQSIGLLWGTAAVTNFAVGVVGYAMHTAGSKTENFNVFKGISEGIGQMGKGLLSFVTGGMYVGVGFWNVGIGAQNTVSSIIARSASKFAVNFIPNYIFDNAF